MSKAPSQTLSMRARRASEYCAYLGRDLRALAREEAIFNASR